MKYYLDNFRGFNDQVISLNTITFLVGENSSGKTSLINAISLLSDYRFWLQGDITSDLCEYSSFDDFHSANHTRDYFTLGMIDESKTGSVHLFCINDDEGLPKTFREIFYCNKKMLIVELNKDTINYQFIKEFSCVNCEKTEKDILDFIDSKDFKKNTMKKMALGNLKGTRVPFDFYRRIIIDKDSEVMKEFKELEHLNPFYNLTVSSLAPIRAKPLPFYSGSKQIFKSEGDHVPFVLKEAILRKEKNSIIEALLKYGKESGLYDNLDIAIYGEKKNSPFELIIQKNSNKYKISSVGYGVSQILPIVSELIFNNNAQIVNIQQPEVHLHPKAQAAFGSFLFTISQKNKKRKIIVETHSDYIIDRFRYDQCKSKEKVDASIFYLHNNGKNNIINEIQIDSNGKYSGDNIDTYREFFFDESFKTMEI